MKLSNSKILILDGSTGVEIQRMGLSEADFRGSLLRNHDVALRGNNDILCLTQPEKIAALHRAYLDAGADIITTNTFNAQRFTQAEYHTEHMVGDINLSAARIARAEADRATRKDGRKRYVAGSVGPTGKTASMSASVADPSAMAVSFDELREAYTEQIAALVEGGVDMLLCETIFDGLNAKAAAIAAHDVMQQKGRQTPLICSVTLSDASGRLLSGMTPEAFLSAIAFAHPAAVGFNCSEGPAGLHPKLRALAAVSPYPTIIYPNAGLPDELGHYSATPELMAREMAAMAREGLVNIAGGCCGTTPEHIRQLAAALRDIPARKVPEGAATPWLSNSEPLRGDEGFINVGERCNVAGSRKFLRLIKEGSYDEAVEIARRQVADGAMMLDINMDDGLLDAPQAMVHFLRLLSAEPECARVPWMIDSSNMEVIRQALRCVQGKPVVNSISLKEGEAIFLAHARECRQMGAAVVVMAFDEQGQATTFERKTQICARAYRLLTEQAQFNPHDIIFDPNILTVATGMAEHDRYALDYIRAVEWIKQSLPGAKTSGGVSNLSFAFRGHNYLREAMHAVFLYHAIRAGLDMAIVNPATKVQYADIPAALVEAITDVLLCRRADAAERLIALAPQYAETKTETPADALAIETLPVGERLAEALRTGACEHLEADLQEAVESLGGAGAVIGGPLMQGMERVGTLFGQGKMFLPQVVKSARTMNRAVAFLNPLLEKESAAQADAGAGGKHFLLATVKGDVHDIGKNIAAVVLRCNGYSVTDLGVMVPPEKIVAAALTEKPDFIGLSGLISPSLNEMAVVARMLKAAGVSVPLFVAGATTSELHTALKIAPEYAPAPVVRVADAAQNPVMAARLSGSDRESEIAAIAARQAQLRQDFAARSSAATPTAPSERKAVEPVFNPPFMGVKTLAEIPIAQVIPLINWRQFLAVWRVKAEQPEGREVRTDADSLLKELAEAGATLCARVGWFAARGCEEKIVVSVPSRCDCCPEGETVEILTPRTHSLAASSDFVAPKGDHIGAFCVTIGERLRQVLSDSHDEYRHLLLQALCDRLAEAGSRYLHEQFVKGLDYQGIRPAVGYPAIPDQAMMHRLNRLLGVEAIGVSVTENGALNPSSTVAGFYIFHPQARY